jgi:hypothetical protein
MSPKESKKAFRMCLSGITGGYLIGSIRAAAPITWDTALTLSAGAFLLASTIWWLIDTVATNVRASDSGTNA